MDKGDISEHNSKKEFLEQIATMYYILDMSQQEIADQLDIGRSSVARFVNEAKQEGIIQFHVTSKSDNARRNDVERQLIKEYKLTDAVVIKENALFEMVAVNYLDSIIPYHGLVGLGIGKTILNVGKYMHLSEGRPNLKIIQMIGSVGRMEREIPATSVLQNWATALNATPHFLSAPAIASSSEIKEVFLQDKNIQDSKKALKDINMAIVGIGNAGPDSTILKTELIPELTYNDLRKSSVGDILLHFYDEHGKLSLDHVSERVMGAAPYEFLNIPTRIALAYGKHKVEAIRAALYGQLVNILVTTDETAKLLF